MYYGLEDRLNDVKISDLLKIYNSNKEYIFFDVSVFNAGTVTKIVLTNNYDKYSNYIKNNYNGYDTILENNSELFYTIEEILCKKYTDLIENWWDKNCSYYIFEDYLKAYKLSNFKFNQLKKIYKNNNHKY